MRDFYGIQTLIKTIKNQIPQPYVRILHIVIRPSIDIETVLLSPKFAMFGP